MPNAAQNPQMEALMAQLDARALNQDPTAPSDVPLDPAHSPAWSKFMAERDRALAEAYRRRAAEPEGLAAGARVAEANGMSMNEVHSGPTGAVVPDGDVSPELAERNRQLRIRNDMLPPATVAPGHIAQWQLDAADAEAEGTAVAPMAPQKPLDGGGYRASPGHPQGYKVDGTLRVPGESVYEAYARKLRERLDKEVY